MMMATAVISKIAATITISPVGPMISRLRFGSVAGGGDAPGPWSTVSVTRVLTPPLAARAPSSAAAVCLTWQGYEPPRRSASVASSAHAPGATPAEPNAVHPRMKVKDMSRPRTLFEKLWDRHVVAETPGHPALLYIDLHLVHEVTSPQAFAGLAAKGLRVRRPDLTVAT